MCGRFRVDYGVDEIKAVVDAIQREGGAVKTGDLRPTDPAPVLVWTKGAITAESMAWGFPRPGGKGVVFNARAETALEKPLFREAVREHPLLVPCAGFYEWVAPRKVPYLFRDKDRPVLYLAGCFRLFSGRACFTVLTTAANAAMAPYHHRMPLVIRCEEHEAWLHGGDTRNFLARESFSFTAEPATSIVEPVQIAEGCAQVQGSLFAEG